MGLRDYDPVRGPAQARAPISAPLEATTTTPNPRGTRRRVLGGIYAFLLVSLAAFGAGRYWDVVRARIDYVNAYYDAVRATRDAYIEAIRTNQKMPVANPALPHVIAVYPPLAQRLGEQGTVVLRVLVLPNGEVGDVQILRSSGYSQLDAAALVGVGSWYYIPAVEDHRPIGKWMVVWIRFRLTGGPV